MANRTVANLTAVISANNTKFKSGINGAKKSLGGFEKSVAAIGPMIVGAFSVAAIGNFAKEAVKLAADAEGIKRAFEALDEPSLLNDLRAAVKGTVSDVELMKSAVKANNFKIPLEQLAMFFKFAQQRAIETGESVDYLVESITNGIARKSLPILDNLGLSATEVREEFNKTGDMAAAVANIISRDIGQASDDTLTTAESTAQLKASWENLKVQVGEAAIKLGDFNTKINRLSEIVSNIKIVELAEKFKTFRTENEMFIKLLEVAYMPLNAYNKLVLEGVKAAGELGEVLGESGSPGGPNLVWVETINEAGIVVRSLVGAVQESSEVIETNTEVQEDANKVIKDNIELVESASLAMWKLSESIGRVYTGTKQVAQLWDDETLFELPEEDVSSVDVGTDKLIESFRKGQDASQQMSETMKYAFGHIASSFAQSMGEVAAGSKTMEDMFSDMSALIMQSLGDILIMAGLGSSPVGVPLILAGLALKGFGSFVGAGGLERGSIPRVAEGYGFSRDSSSSIYGNDIRIANAAAISMYNRVG